MELQDRFEVADVLHHYSYCIDTHQEERLNEVFTSDASVDLGYGRWVGIDNIVTRYVEVLSNFEGTAHAISNVRPRLKESSGESTSYVTAWHWLHREAGDTEHRPADFTFVAVYLDSWRRTDEGWRISGRRARKVGPTSLAAGSLPAFMLPK